METKQETPEVFHKFGKNGYPDFPERDIEALKLVGKAADELGVMCCVVGGYVRDLLMNKPSDDLDFLVRGSGIKVAEKVAEMTNGKLSVFESYGTAHVLTPDGIELEFVGARKEFYHRESRNPIVEEGSLYDDLSRRDFTINSIAAFVNENKFGDIIDFFGGMKDIKDKVIRCVGKAEERFNEDPLRILRGIRFSSKYGFDIDDDTFEAMCKTGQRLSIITRERITEEVNKMLMTRKPSIAFNKLAECNILDFAVPGLSKLCRTHVHDFQVHKNIFYHTMIVLDNMAERSDNLWDRWAALLHDIGKPNTIYYSDKRGWAFDYHELVGADMVENIFKACKLPLNELKYVQNLVFYHMHPTYLCEDNVSDAAIRRFMFNVGDCIDGIIRLSDCDMSTQHMEKIDEYRRRNMALRKRIGDIQQQDNLRNFKLAINGDDIMQEFGIEKGVMVGRIKDYVKDLVIDGKVPNDKESLIMAAREAIAIFSQESSVN